MAKVELKENMRYFDAEDSNFNIKAGELKVLPEKCLKSMSIKHYLLNSLLMVKEGYVLIPIKHAKMIFIGEQYPYAFGKEHGKFFRFNTELGTTEWFNEDELPKFATSKLNSDTLVESSEVKPEIEERHKVVGSTESEPPEIPTPTVKNLPNFDAMTLYELESYASEHNLLSHIKKLKVKDAREKLKILSKEL